MKKMSVEETIANDLIQTWRLHNWPEGKAITNHAMETLRISVVAGLTDVRAFEREQAAKRIEYHLDHGNPVSDQRGAYSFAAKIVREAARPVEPSEGEGG